MGLARKNFLIVTTMIALCSMLLLVLLYFVMPIYYSQVKKQELKQDFQRVVKQLDKKPEAEILDKIDDYDRATSNILLSLLSDGENVVYPRPDDTEALQAERDYLEKGDFDEIGSWTVPIVSAEGKKFYLLADYGFHSLSDVSQTLLTFYPFILVLIIILAISAAFVYSRLSTRRIRTISETARQMQSLEKGLACEIVGTDEVATLAEDVNSLYDKLLTSIEELKTENERTAAREREKSDFLRMTSHELKTPIASMLGLVEGMIYNVGDFKNHDPYLKKCRSILQEQSHLVQSILEATTLDMALEDSKESFFLDRLLEDSLTSYQSLAQVKDFDFQVQLGPTQLVGNQVYLLKAIKNILDNAFRYSRQGATIRLVCQEDYLLVDNQVERLLDPEELKRIFQPLYRPDYSRNRKDGGTGIGLFLVQQILDKHQFSYAFYPLDKDTMRFIIHFN